MNNTRQHHINIYCTSFLEILYFYVNFQRVSRQADDFSSMATMLQYGIKYLPVLMDLFTSLTGGEGGGSGGGGAGGGLLDLAASILGGGTKVESSAGVDPVKTNTEDRIDPTDLVKVAISNLPCSYYQILFCTNV